MLRVQGVFSTVIADMVYGVAVGGIDNDPNTKDGDPAGVPQSNGLTFDDAFDISSLAAQELVQAHLDDLVTYTTPNGALAAAKLVRATSLQTTANVHNRVATNSSLRSFFCNAVLVATKHVSWYTSRVTYESIRTCHEPGAMHADSRPIFTSIEYNPLDEMRRFCARGTEEQQALFDQEQRGRFCEPADGLNGLPSGNTFNALAYRLLAVSPDVRAHIYYAVGSMFVES